MRLLQATAVLMDCQALLITFLAFIIGDFVQRTLGTIQQCDNYALQYPKEERTKKKLVYFEALPLTFNFKKALTKEKN